MLLPRKVKERNSPREGEGIRKDEREDGRQMGHRGHFGVDSDNSQWKRLLETSCRQRTKGAQSLCPVCGALVSLWHGDCEMD